MSPPRAALPNIPRDAGSLHRCVRSRTIHISDSARIVRWRCQHDGAALQAERSHDSFVLSVVSSGACRVRSGNWQSNVDPATALLHAPGIPYRTTHPYGVIDSGWNVAFRTSLVLEILDRHGRQDIGLNKPIVAIHGESSRYILRQLNGVSGHANDREGFELEEKSLELLDWILSTQIARSTTRSEATSSEHRRVTEHAREYLNEHFRSNILLADVAAAASASPAHLCRVFKSATTMPMREYIHRLRLAAAIAGMSRGRSSLTQLALEAGFSSHAHFSSIARRYIGSSPSKIRARM